MPKALSDEELGKIDAYWRAANYLSVGQIYLKDNPLLEALNAKILPEKEITEPVSGLLFFQIVGKVKAKDLELHYKGPAGPMALRFKGDK